MKYFTTRIYMYECICIYLIAYMYKSSRTRSRGSGGTILDFKNDVLVYTYTYK
jgi:hypothetical protein